MLQLDQERRIDPDTALKHTFVTMNHLVDYAHLNNVRMSFQMMEVCNKKRMAPGSTGSNSMNNGGVSGPNGVPGQSSSSDTAAAVALINNFIQQQPSGNTTGFGVNGGVGGGAGAAAAVPYFAAAAAARAQHQMPNGLSIFPAYQGILRIYYKKTEFFLIDLSVSK